MEVTTGTIGEGRSQWTYEVTVEFVQVPDDKRDAYWATLAWLADEILKELSAESGRATPRSADEVGEAVLDGLNLSPKEL